MKVGFSAVVAGAIVLAGCSASSEAGVAYPSEQRAFFAMNKSCQQKYEAGQNEIQKSLAFNQCNKERLEFSRHQKIAGWVGEIAEISTDQGADVVSVQIKSEVDGFDITFGTVNNRVSDFATHSLITQSNPLFNVLAQMKIGDLVTFDADLLRDPEGSRGVWESSITERGSMDEPEFNVRFSDIRPYAEGSGSTTAVATTSQRSKAPEDVAPADGKSEQYRSNLAKTDESQLSNASDVSVNESATQPPESQEPRWLVQGTYATVRSKLIEEGYSPDSDYGSGMWLDGDPGECGNAGCSGQWVRQGEQVCVAASVNDNLPQSQWEAGARYGSCD